jgi:hypothetical protein
MVQLPVRTRRKELRRLSRLLSCLLATSQKLLEVVPYQSTGVFRRYLPNQG